MQDIKIGKGRMERLRLFRGGTYLSGTGACVGGRNWKTILSTAREEAAAGIDFPYNHPFDFAGVKRGTAVWEVEHIIPSDFQMIIYGPCVNPRILINDYLMRYL